MQKTDTYIFYLAIAILVFFYSTSGGLGLFLVGIIIAIYFHFFFKNITYAFLICLVIISNPGRIYTGEPFGLDIHFLRLSDIFFYLGFLCLFSPKIKQIPLDNRIKKLLPVLYFFSIYQIIVSIILKLDSSTLFEIIKYGEQFKFLIFGVYILIPAYKIAQENFKLFINNIIILALIFASVYLISFYTDLKIVDFTTEVRFRGSNIYRNTIQNTEIFKLIIYFAIAAYLILKSRDNRIVYITGILTAVIPVIGLYRLEMFYIGMTILLVFFLVIKNIGFPYSKVWNLSFYLVILLLCVFLFFPIIVHWLSDTYHTTVQEFFGRSNQRLSQTRTIIELPKQLNLIRNNPLWGIGFRPEWFTNYHNYRDWGLSDIPLTSTLAMYGIIGMIIYYSRFYLIFRAARNVHMFIRTNRESVLSDFKIETVAIISLSAYFITMVTFRLFYIGWELTLARLQPEFGVFIGIYYSLINSLTSNTNYDS